MRALLVANYDDADPGYIGQRFTEHGFVGERFKEHGGKFEHCERENPDSWPSLDGADLVVLLGSWWSAYWPDVAKSVRAECELILETHRRGIPLFGICFGAQIMATAFGGSAQRAQKYEVGWHNVSAEPPFEVIAGKWMQWHYDTFTVPDSLEVIATSQAGPQAIRAGRSFATQFHPEVTEQIVARWASESGEKELAKVGLKASDLIAQTRVEVTQSAPAAARLVDWFLETSAK
jgi:GMP synthase-like glutamine amidotransferase